MEFPTTPEAPKSTIIVEGEKAAAKRAEFSVPSARAIYLGAGEIYYTNDYDGTYITLEKWKEQIDNIHAPEEGGRKDFN